MHSPNRAEPRSMFHVKHYPMPYAAAQAEQSKRDARAIASLWGAAALAAITRAELSRSLGSLDAVAILTRAAARAALFLTGRNS